MILLSGPHPLQSSVDLTEDGIAACYPLREAVGGKAEDGS